MGWMLMLVADMLLIYWGSGKGGGCFSPPYFLCAKAHGVRGLPLPTTPWGYSGLKPCVTKLPNCREKNTQGGKNFREKREHTKLKSQYAKHH